MGCILQRFAIRRTNPNPWNGTGVVRVVGLNIARWRPTLSVVTRTGKGANDDDSANSSNNKELAMVVGGDGHDSIEVLEWSYSLLHQTHDAKRKTNNSTTGRVRKMPNHEKESPKSALQLHSMSLSTPREQRINAIPQLIPSKRQKMEPN